MNQKNYIIATVAVVLLCSFTLLQSGNWKVNEEKYSITFDTRGASGTIGGLKGTVVFNEADLSSSRFDVSADVNTLNTGSNLKNKHAKGEDFLDVEHYPTISFTSEKIAKTNTGYSVTGKLKIKDVTKEVSIPFTYSGKGSEATFKGNFEFNREDFKLERMFIGEIIKVELVVPVKK